MKDLLHTLESISKNFGKGVSFLLLVMTLVTVVVVLIRYLFQSGSIALQESITYLHASLFILAAGYALQENAHVRVDIFYQKYSDKTRAIINLLGTLFLLLPFCFFSFFISFDYVQRSWQIAEKSADAGGIPAVFLIKSLILALVCVLVFQALIEILRNILVLKGELSLEEQVNSESV